MQTKINIIIINQIKLETIIKRKKSHNISKVFASFFSNIQEYIYIKYNIWS